MSMLIRLARAGLGFVRPDSGVGQDSLRLLPVALREEDRDQLHGGIGDQAPLSELLAQLERLLHVLRSDHAPLVAPEDAVDRVAEAEEVDHRPGHHRHHQHQQHQVAEKKLYAQIPHDPS